MTPNPPEGVIGLWAILAAMGVVIPLVDDYTPFEEWLGFQAIIQPIIAVSMGITVLVYG